MSESSPGTAPKKARPSRAKRAPVIDDRLIGSVCSRLEEDRRVRRTLPDGGRVAIDRQLPFLFVYRPPLDAEDPGTRQLVRSEASYLIAPEGKRHRAKTRRLGTEIVRTVAPVFGRFLLVEIWAGPAAASRTSDDGSPALPGFRVVAPKTFAQSSTVRALVDGLEEVELFKQLAEVEVTAGGKVGPRGQSPMATAAEMRELDAVVIGIEVRPIYRDPDTGETYPIALRQLARRFSRAVRKACFEFARTETTARPRHYQSLGTRAFTKAAWDVDSSLAGIAGEFDLLLYVTPTNAVSAFKEFRSSGCERVPEFHYRPRDKDLAALKRRLHNIQIRRVEDPMLQYLFREKKSELDLALSLLIERESPRFLPLSAALYGQVDDVLVGTARQLLDSIDPASPKKTRTMSVDRFVERANLELDGYRAAYPPFSTGVEVRDELTSLMVSGGELLVGRGMSLSHGRVDALLQHEVGTHVVTHWNGQAQPFKLLSVGLAHYDELQEGLAVFAEYLAGGLTGARMRTLAARVVGARMMLDGAAFLDVFRALRDDHGFAERPAWQVTMRLYRGGGFVKDSVYLRGLQSVLDYLRDGGHLETLLVGKVATEHAPMIEELQRRRLLNPSPLRPAYLDDPDGQARLDRARLGLELVDLVDR